VLEGLRRLDENIAPGVAFPPDYVHDPDELAGKKQDVNVEVSSETERSFPPAFLTFGKESGKSRKPLFIGAIVVAVVASVAVIGVPAGWYSKKKPVAAAENVSQAPVPVSSQTETPAQPQPSSTEAQSATEDPAALAAKRQREKERKAREAAKAAENPTAVAPPVDAAKPGAKRVVVTVTYDESGRVTQASGGDANALRIARQKRFPPGIAGSATVSIPIN
jgi:flagellar basal body-associated protein FliL